jgi:hypothetical protein
MTDFASMRRQVRTRRGRLERQVSTLQAELASLQAELDTLVKVDEALGAGGAMKAPAGRVAGRKRRGGRKAAPRKGGKWRPGRPGRPPKWYVEQQAAAGKGGKKGKRGGRRGRARKVEAPAPIDVAPPAQS